MLPGVDTYKLTEDTALTGVTQTREGFLTAQVKCARSGIQQYSGSEIGLPALDIANVWRPEEEVFSEDSMRTYAGRPATDNHPHDLVDSTNWKELAVGNLGSKVVRNGDYIEVPLVISDGAAVQKIKDGKRALSMGYLVDISIESGTTPDGEQYDAIQKNLRMNHIALVDEGRAGAKVRIGDSWSDDRKPQRKKPQETKSMNTKVIDVDGLSVETTDAGEKAIRKLEGKLSAATDSLTKANTDHEAAINTATEDHDKALAAKDTELAAKDTKIAELEKQVVTGADLDKLVADRQVFVDKAKALAPDLDFAGKSDSDIKSMVVDHVRGADFTKDKSDVYVDAAFDFLEVPEGSSGDKVRDALKNQMPGKAANDHGQSEYEARIVAGRAGVQK